MKKILIYISKFCYSYRYHIFLYYFLGFIVNLISVISPYIVGRFIDIFSFPGTNIKDIIFYCTVFVTISSINLIISYIMDITFLKTSSKIIFDIICDLIAKVQNSSMLCVQVYDSAYLSQRLENDVNSLVNITFSIVSKFFSNIVVLLFCLFILGRFDLILLMFMLCMSIVCILSYNYFKKKIYFIKMLALESQSDFFSKTNMQLKNIKLIKSHSLQNEFLSTLHESFKVLYSNLVTKQKFDFAYMSINSVINITVQVFIFIYGGKKVLDGDITIGEFTILSIFYNRLLSSIGVFFDFGKDFQMLRTNFNRIEELETLEKVRNGNIELLSISDITIDSISFSYKKNLIFCDFSYIFKKENLYLIKGLNGSGKSTILDLILGLYINKLSGNVYFNGISINDIDMIKLRKNKISFLPQKLELLPYLYLNSSTYDLELLKKMLYDFRIEKYVTIKDDKIYLNKDSTEKFSGGEIQKILLLLALSKKSEIIILDEPTSAIEEHSKEILVKFLNSIRKHKIIIISTHDNIFDEIADYIIKI